MVSGLVNSKTLKTGVEDLNFVAYEIIEDFTELKPSEQLYKLNLLGFEIAKNQIINSINELLSSYIRGQLNICMILSLMFSGFSGSS